jgi:hypothetical protein
MTILLRFDQGKDRRVDVKQMRFIFIGLVLIVLLVLVVSTPARQGLTI